MLSDYWRGCMNLECLQNHCQLSKNRWRNFMPGGMQRILLSPNPGKPLDHIRAGTNGTGLLTGDINSHGYRLPVGNLSIGLLYGRINSLLCKKQFKLKTMKRLLLISNSTNVGEPYLGWPRSYISAFLEGTGVKNILICPLCRGEPGFRKCRKIL